MENIVIRFFVVLSTLFLFFSCDSFLDRELSTDLTYQQVTNNYSYTGSRVAGVYSRLRKGFLPVDEAMMAAMSDEAEHARELSSVQYYNLGSWNAFINPDNIWPYCYVGIRNVNLFLVSADSVDLDLYKYDPQQDQQNIYKSRLEEINRWKYEVRFLRAYFYFELVKRYGGVPIITEAQKSVEGDYSNTERNTLAECVQFIISECDSVASILPVRYRDTDLGRATSVSALALRSRMLLYAASDLYNNPSWSGGYQHPEFISLTGDRREKWTLAADAAKKAIDLVQSTNSYRISPNYSSMFSSTSHTNSEVLFCIREAPTNSFEKTNYSVGFNLGNSGTMPSQNLVDLYEMTNGKAIDEQGSNYHPNEPYMNRDPRLNMTIVTNNSMFNNRLIQIWNGGLDGFPIANATRTGYYLRKYVNENLNLLINQTSVHSWVVLRLTELYLNYAEALNECDPGNPEIAVYYNKSRGRTGVLMPNNLPADLDQVEVRKKIRNERSVEFAFEDHRLWDLRRWMQAETFLSRPLRGIRAFKSGANTFSYEVDDVETRIFNPRMYLYPIPQNEMQIARKFVQNPFW